ncbi:hypothetical protein GPECTOR_41g616 [Gonium pectorale]|uniref:Uncharacterized protein n=1 Tax=Gonium pectorale TaxID=33097 RepID=A0A150G9Y9_GONPE|nr:hypothetical protein GPECTOR_41g616 [Gonium pectorale]|eukprot:KXZ46652.1 hypothetical protein GPECTOR_41g616 [Gonium pectorale]
MEPQKAGLVLAEDAHNVGTQRLYNNVAGAVGASMQLFEQVCVSSVFKPPIRISIPPLEPVKLPEDLEGGISTSTEDGDSEEALAVRIATLRQELAMVDRRCASLRQEVQRVDKHIISCGDGSEYMTIAATAQSHKHTILAIAQAAENLQNMMEKAARLRAAGGQPAAGVLSDKKLDAQGGISNPAGTTLAAVNALASLLHA